MLFNFVSLLFLTVVIDAAALRDSGVCTRTDCNIVDQCAPEYKDYCDDKISSYQMNKIYESISYGRTGAFNTDDYAVVYGRTIPITQSYSREWRIESFDFGRHTCFRRPPCCAQSIIVEALGTTYCVPYVDSTFYVTHDSIIRHGYVLLGALGSRVMAVPKHYVSIRNPRFAENIKRVDDKKVTLKVYNYDPLDQFAANMYFFNERQDTSQYHCCGRYKTTKVINSEAEYLRLLDEVVPPTIVELIDEVVTTTTTTEAPPSASCCDFRGAFFDIEQWAAMNEKNAAAIDTIANILNATISNLTIPAGSSDRDSFQKLIEVLSNKLDNIAAAEKSGSTTTVNFDKEEIDQLTKEFLHYFYYVLTGGKFQTDRTKRSLFSWFVDGIADLMKPFWSLLITIVKPVLKEVVSFLFAKDGLIIQILNLLTDEVGDLLDTVIKLLELIIDAFEPFLDAILRIIEKLLKIIIKIIKHIYNIIFNLLVKESKIFSELFGEAANVLTFFSNNLINLVKFLVLLALNVILGLEEIFPLFELVLLIATVSLYTRNKIILYFSIFLFLLAYGTDRKTASIFNILRHIVIELIKFIRLFVKVYTLQCTIELKQDRYIFCNDTEMILYKEQKIEMCYECYQEAWESVKGILSFLVSYIEKELPDFSSSFKTEL